MTLEEKLNKIAQVLECDIDVLLEVLSRGQRIDFRTKNGDCSTCGDLGFGPSCRETCLMSNGREFPLSQYGISWTSNYKEVNDLPEIYEEYKPYYYKG